MSITGSEQWMYQSAAGFYDFPIEQSLRFNDDDSAYLSWTPASAGNRKTWTWSGWVKRGNIGTVQNFFAAGDGTATNRVGIDFLSDNRLGMGFRDGSDAIVSSAVFRDPSAWYHIVAAVDTTDATASNRMKLYVNGEQITALDTANYPSQNYDTFVNATNLHVIGARYRTSVDSHFDGYLADVNFIDGTALDASSFGETKSGIWIPKDPTGLTYGTNGFRLNFADTTTASGFNTVTYTGKGGAQSVSGVGFSSAPDLVWIKNRDSAAEHVLHDSVRGAANLLQSDSTAAELNRPTYFTSFDADGFSFGDNVSNYNTSGSKYVAWCWDAGSGSAASNTDGSITSTVKANTDYGFSIATFTGTGANATVGHGLGQTPDAVIVKQRSVAGNHWCVWTNALSGTQFLYLDDTNAPNTNAGIWNSTTPTSSVFSVGSDAQTNGSGNNLVAYCFAEKTGYSKIGSYTGNGSTSNSITGLGFKPAFLLIKNASVSSSWYIFDNTRDTDDVADKYLRPNLSNAEGVLEFCEFTADGFDITSSAAEWNGSGNTILYMAFADTRDAAFWKDVSGQGNDWQHNNLTFSDVVPDGTNNFATLNPLVDTNHNVSLSEGNLKVTGSSLYPEGYSTTEVNGDKFYAEAVITAMSNQYTTIGVAGFGSFTNHAPMRHSPCIGYRTDGYKDVDASYSAYGSSYTVGDVIGIAVDVLSDSITFYKNGVSQGAISYTFADQSFFFASGGTGSVSGTNSIVWNFGQDSTFAGNRAAGGNQDENGYGDFAYAPPSGYLALCSANLPTGAIDTLNDETPEDYFNTVLYNGTGATQSITGVGFQPDLVWTKARDTTYSNLLVDSVRGVTKELRANGTQAEATNSGVTSFDADGYTLGSYDDYNRSINTFVSWNWKAGGTGVSNTDGSITSTVSVGATSQQNWFSIVSYTGTGSNATVGHGLNTEPQMIITKARANGSSYWLTYHSGLASPSTSYMALNTTDAVDTGGASVWNSTAPTSSVFSVGTSTWINPSGGNMIAYCFANAEGMCKAGSYVGNGSGDGTFVFTGHRPALLLLKRTDAAGDAWTIFDSVRNPYNEVDNYLYPSASDAEYGGSGNDGVDFLSNGFKLSNTYTGLNASGGSYIYLSIAEQPFAFANAR